VHQLAPDSPGYNSINVFKMTGRVDRAILERSLNELVHRHEILQTIYTIDQEGKPVQVILPFHSFGLSSVDFSSLKADEKEKSIRDYAIEHGQHHLTSKMVPSFEALCYKLALKKITSFSPSTISLLTGGHAISSFRICFVCMLLTNPDRNPIYLLCP